MAKFLVKDCDIFYISFDEINADANWNRLRALWPDAKRIHGVLGFDKAHKTCALAATTRRFVTVDGDNWVNDGALDYELDETDIEDVCFSFKSRNIINGLEYGNGGIKVWDKQSMLASCTHELADTTDFCWDIRYYQIDWPASTSVNNCSPYQAWRSGYREGVKMSYINGKPLDDFTKQWRSIWRGNLSRLNIWCSIGRDVDNGIWAILGARMGLLDIAQHSISNTAVNDYVWFQNKWSEIENIDPEHKAIECARQLNDQYGFWLPEIAPTQSSWFKMVYINPKRKGLML